MKRNGFILAICAVLAIIFVWYTWIYEGFRYSYTEEEALVYDSWEADEMYADFEAHQTFIAKERYLKGTAFFLINLPDDRRGTFNVELKDKDGNSIATSSFDVSEWEVDTWEWLDFDERVTPGKEYEFVITLSDYSGKVIPFLLRVSNSDSDIYTWYQNDGYEGNDQSAAMRFRYAIPAPGYEKFAYTLLMGVLILVVLSAFGIITVSELIKKIVAGASLAGLFVLYIPNIAYKLKYINLDDSWRYFLNVANPKGYIFGKDIIFTYGPLGYLCYMMNLPENKAYFIAGVIIWSVIIASFVYLLIKLFMIHRDGRLSGLSLALSFILAFSSYKVLERDNFLLYLVILSVTVYEIISEYKPKTPLLLYFIPNGILVVMFFAKFSTSSSAFAFMLLYVLYKGILTKEWKGVFLFAPAIILMPIAYLIYNPSISELCAYVSGFMKHSNDWMESWQYDVTVQGTELLALIVIMVLYVVLVVLAIVRDYRTAGIMVALCSSMFFVYKYATTRHGLPCGIWLFGMMYSVIPLAVKPSNDAGEAKFGKQFFIPLCACMIVTGLFEANVMHNSFDNLSTTLKEKVHNWTHLSETGLEETVYESCWEIPDGVLQAIGDNTVCVYPYRVALDAVYPQLNIVYYPTGTNGEASEWSDRMVADWYASEKGSEYIILDDETVDGHIKYLENPLTWRAIEANYSLIGRDGDHCILKKNDQIGRYERDINLIKSEEYTFSDTLTPPSGAEYVKIYVDYSLLGKIKKFFYHVGTLHMDLGYDDGTGISGRIIKGNLPTGFELCEYPQNTDEFVQYMIDKQGKKIESIRIFGPGIEDLSDKITVEWYSFE